MSPARLTVCAVIVSDGRSRLLPAVLDAVTRQDPSPDSVLLALTDGAAEPDLPPDSPIEIVRCDVEGFGAGVSAALGDREAPPHEFLWLLHDDSAPEPGALSALTATARKRQRAGVVGAAHVQWDDPQRLVALGTTVSRAGARRLTLVEEADINQGQYDHRDDVLAVSLAGALVRRDVWNDLGGLDPAYDGWGDSVDLCRRAWRAGHDVVVVPGAKIRHRQESLYGLRQGLDRGRRSTYGARRAAEWFHAMAFARWWALLPLALWCVAGSLARAVLRVAQNEPRLVLADLGVPWRVGRLLVRLPRSRRRVRAAGTHRSVERPLLASATEVFAYVRSREWGAYEQWRAASAPSDVVRAELRGVARRRRRALAAVLVVATAVSLAVHGGWVLALANGRMLAGSVLGVTDIGVDALWDRAVSGWSDQGLGATAVDAGLSPVLLPLSLAPGGLAVGLGLTLTFAPVLAAVGAWALVGAFSRSTWVRGLAATSYALSPFLVAAMESGRIGALVVHLVLPWFVLATVRAGGWHCGERVGAGEEHPAVRFPSPSAAAAAAVLLVVLTVAAPVLCAPGAALLIGLGVVSRRARWRFWAAIIPALVVAAPGALAVVRADTAAHAWALMFREPGPSGPSPFASVTDLVVTGTSFPAPGMLAVVTPVLAAVVVMAALVSAVTTRRWLASSAAVLAAAVGIGIAAGAQQVVLDIGGFAVGAAHTGWPGIGMSVATVSTLVLVSLGAARWSDVAVARATAPGRADAWRRVMRGGGAGIALGLVTALVAGHAAAFAWPTREPLGDVRAADRAVLPLVAALEQEFDTRARVAVLDEDGQDLTMSLLATDGTPALLNDASAEPSSTAEDALGQIAAVVAAMSGGGDARPDVLAQWGIGALVAAPGADAVVSALSQYPELGLMGASDRGSSWRVQRDGVSAPVSRAWLETEDGAAIPMGMDRSSGALTAPEPGVLVMAVPQGSGWEARLDGARMPQVEDDLGRSAFVIDRPGRVTVAHESPYRLWWWAAVALTGWSMLAAIPLHTHRFREAHA